MKTKILSLFSSFFTLALFSAQPAFSAEATARITRIWTEKDQAHVEVQTTGPILKVTLESSPRVGRRAWEPRAVRYLTNGEPENVSFTFTSPLGSGMELLRVRSDLRASALPASYYSGGTNFVSAASQSGPARGALDSVAPTAGESSAQPDRSVVESDIWKVEGDRLFFFNQNRGLQVIDIANPDQPSVTGAYDLAAAGDQMYVIDGTNIVLLARDNCGWGGNSESKLHLLQLRNGAPVLVKEIAVPGQIAESRLVGTALYVVANSYQQRIVAKEGAAPSEHWEWGSEVTSYDLSSLSTAARQSSDWVGGYGNVIYATDRKLFVAQSDYSTSTPGSVVHAYDIASPNGEFTKLSAFSTGGIVRDKFKMNMSGSVFVAVVQESTRPSGTYVSTYSFANPQKPERLAHLKLIENEQLFATRFHNDLLYVVTFFVVDPLWIVDLSDPANPRKVGELEIPGWSTYLQPIGDKLLAIGLDRTNGYQRTAVQLFDVANPAKPALLSKVLIGDQWSGSEANWDEKAFGVLPQQELLLVPFHSSGTNGYFEGVQLIDLKADTLVKRGIIMQNMGARRATMHRDRILSLSSRELLSVDATDRDKPRVTQKTELSWSADQVHLAGDFIVEIDSSGSEGPAVRVVDAGDTGRVRQTVVLTNLPYLGSTLANGKLLVLQGRSVEYRYPEIMTNGEWKPISTNRAVYFLSVFDAANLPALTLTSQDRMESDRTESVYGRYDALGVKDDLIVWVSGNSGGMPWWYWRGGPVMDLAPSASLAADGRFAPWYGSASGHMLATATAQPKFVSEVSLTGTNGWWSFSRAHTTNGLVYISHSINEYDPSIDPPAYTWTYWDGTKDVIVTNDPPAGQWVRRDFLDVVDFNDDSDPVVRKPVNIPGSLLGIDRAGEIVYARGSDFNGNEALSAASYDGVQAHLIDSLDLKGNWPRPSFANGAVLYLGVPGTNNIGGQLESWKLGAAGKFERVFAVDVKEPVQEIDLFGGLLVTQAGLLSLYDARAPERPVLIGAGQPNACYGVQLGAADGSVQRGLWAPMGWYGVVHIPVSVATEPLAE